MRNQGLKPCMVCICHPRVVVCSSFSGGVTDYCKFSGLRQQKLTLSQFWRSETQNGLAGLHSSWSLQESICFPVYFSFQRPTASLGSRNLPFVSKPAVRIFQKENILKLQLVLKSLGSLVRTQILPVPTPLGLTQQAWNGVQEFAFLSSSQDPDSAVQGSHFGSHPTRLSTL